MKKLAAVAALAVILSVPAWATTKTVTLSVSGMTCATCPITVKMALSKVSGAQKIEVTYEGRGAGGAFEEAKTSVSDLTKATTNAGFPSTVKP